MITAVQLRPARSAEAPRCDLVHGTPVRVAQGELGPVALFQPGTLVAYRLHHRRTTRLFIFRTLDVDDPLGASVPGVRPRVRLLLALRTARRAHLAERLLASLVRIGRDPGRLSDLFYLRLGAVLSGRLPRPQAVRVLVASEVGP